MLAHAAPAAALSCLHLPFQRPGERFKTTDLVAHVEVLEVHADRTMDVRIKQVFHGSEDRPVVSVDARSTLGWNMAPQWGFKPFSAGTQWLIVMFPAQTGREVWRPQLCRALLKVESGSAIGYVSDLARWDRIALDDLGARVTSVAQGLP